MKARLELGAELDLLSPEEFDAGVGRLEGLWRSYAEGLRHLRLPILTGTVPASGALTIGSSSLPDAGNPYCGPAQGYLWRVCRISIYGMVGNDALQVFYGDPRPQAYVGTLSATSTEWDSGRGLLLHPGDHLTLQGTGLTVGAVYTLNGEAIEAPAEQSFKLIGA